LKWFVVVNPLAGSGSAGRKWPGVSKALVESGISFHALFTSGPENTRALVKNAMLKGFDGIAVYGGDGTISDAASVIASSPGGPVLAFLPAGSGNDWARSIGFHSPSFEASIASIKNESFRTVDSAVAMWNGNERFFLNSSGTGFDALVLNRAVKLRKHISLNRTCYAASLLVSSFFPPVWQAIFSVDGSVFYAGRYLTFTAGVGCYSGGGMRLSPDSVPDDGKLDGLCLTPMNFFSIVFNLKKVFDGTLGRTRWARNARGDAITIESINNSKLLLELDGEPVNLQGASSLELVSTPESLTVIAPAG